MNVQKNAVPMPHEISAPRDTDGLFGKFARSDRWTRFQTSVAGMADIAQWHMFRLTWNTERGKFDKKPCGLDGGLYPIDAAQPSNWNSFDTVLARVQALDCDEPGATVRYAMGFRLTTEVGYFLLDLDNCVEGNTPNQFARELLHSFHGAMQEVSSTGNGLHIIGICRPLPHAKHCKPKSIELYTEGQSIAFGISYRCVGSTDRHFDSEIRSVVSEYFQPSQLSTGDAVRAAAPTGMSDEVVVQKAIAASSSIRQLRGKLTFAQLYQGVGPRNSENDMALAAMLAFWTGRDEAQIERVMRSSGRVREKWSSARGDMSWLQYTIQNACIMCKKVYGEVGSKTLGHSPACESVSASLVDTALSAGGGASSQATSLITEEASNEVDVLLKLILGAASDKELVNELVPRISSRVVPSVLQAKIVTAFQSKLKSFGSGLRIAQVRALLFPTPNPPSCSQEMPQWAKDYVFVNDGDSFFNTVAGTKMTSTGFRANFNRYMPQGDYGRYGDAAEACLTTYGMPTVDRVGYRPDEGPRYVWEGATYANLYSPSSAPQVADSYTPVGRVGIAAFHMHLWEMCSRRAEVFNNFLYWFAHNVQHPGRKIRWAPLLKGINGDGKTLMFAVLRSAMGWRNVSVTGNSVLTASNGFNDWSTGSAVNVIEEIYISGKMKYQIYNSTKEVITNDVISVNPKGRVSYRTHNNTNHAATSNHSDAIPLTTDDRRWFVIFTPWATKLEMLAVCGLTQQAWKARTTAIAAAMNCVPGEIRRWLLEIPIPADFDVDGEALSTPEKRRMLASSCNEAESIAMSILVEGGHGVTNKVLSSHCFSRLLTARCLADNVDSPKTTTLNHLLSRIGFQKVEKQLKWRDRSHTIWVRDGVSEDSEMLRGLLDASLVRPKLP